MEVLLLDTNNCRQEGENLNISSMSSAAAAPAAGGANLHIQTYDDDDAHLLMISGTMYRG